MVYPLYSTVSYLTDNGAPTVIFNQVSDGVVSNNYNTKNNT